MRIILHIGVPKSGSTAIQWFLHANRARLAEQRVLYPASIMEWGRMHTPLAVVFSDPDNLQLQHYALKQTTPEARAARQVEIQDLLSQEIATAKPDTLVLSSEHLTLGLYRPAELARLKAFLNTFSDEIEVLFFAREQAAATASLYCEGIRAGSVKRFKLTLPAPADGHGATGDANPEPYIPPLPQTGAQAPFWLDYMNLLKVWEAGFGHGNVTVRPFHRSHFADGDLLAETARCMGFDIGADWMPPRRENRALSKMGTEALRWYNIVAPLYGADHQVTWLRKRVGGRRIASFLPGAPFQLSPADKARVQASYAQSNSDLAHRLGLAPEALFPS